MDWVDHCQVHSTSPVIQISLSLYCPTGCEVYFLLKIMVFEAEYLNPNPLIKTLVIP